MINLLRSTCPVCKEKQPERSVFTRDFSGMNEIVPFKKYDVFVCPKCGMVYAGNIEESMPLVKYYDIMSKYTSDTYVHFGAIREDQKSLADFLAENVSKNSSVIDIGCASGGLLKAMQLKGFTNLMGLEVAHENVKYGQEHYHLDVCEGALGGDTSAINNKKFDLIIMEGVLEHILTLQDTIHLLKKHLTDDGMLFFGVPDLEQFSQHDDLYQQFSVEHVNFFCRESLENLLSMNGFKTVAVTPHLSGGLEMLFQLDGEEKSYDRDCCGAKYMEKYLSHCEDLLTCLKAKISVLSTPYYVWGAGTHTAMLFQSGVFKSENVIGIIDSNRNYQGHIIYGHKIIDANEIKEDFPIIISTQDAQQAILLYIADTLHLNNECITFY